MTHGPVLPVYTIFLLYRPTLPSVILHTTYRPMAPFTLTSLTSVTVSCMTHGPVSPAVYTNFLLYGPMLLSHLVYNLQAHSALYVEPHIHLMYNSQACIALIHVFVIYSVGSHCPQLSCVQLMGLHCCHARCRRGSGCRKARSDTRAELVYDGVEGSMYIIGAQTAMVSRMLART